MSTDKTRRTPLTEEHGRRGATLVPFAGYEMPVVFSSMIDEHMAVRQAVGLFDVSHMGEVFVTGPDALSLLQRITCNDVAKLADGQVHYSALTTPAGTVVDDLLIYRFDARRFMLCVNASNRAKDVEWILAHRQGEATVEDRSDEYAQIAIQGPKALATLQPLVDVDLTTIPYYWFVEGRVGGLPAIISRTGYTGEDGFELYLGNDGAVPVWRALLEAGAPHGVVGCGLGARDTLRLEAKMALYGNDIDDTTNLLEAGLGWICKFKKGDFIGREALLKIKEAGPSRRLVGFELTGRGVARPHYPVLLDGARVAEVTSGAYAPYLKKCIGLTYLPADRCAVGTPLAVEIRGKRVEGVVAETPFYRRKD